MVLLSPKPVYTRQNRRRERPGARSRHSLARKEGIQHDLADGISTARDSTVVLPFEYAKPSPMLRQNFDQSWMRWKARDAQQKLKDEKARQELENEQRRLFGGDVDDDELRRLGVLYEGFDEDEDLSSFSAASVRFVPSFRSKASRRSKKRSSHALSLLPPFLASSYLSDNAEIARFMASSSTSHFDHKITKTNTTTNTSTIQHRPSADESADSDPPQSLPPTPSPSAQSQDPDLALSSLSSLFAISPAHLFPSFPNTPTYFDDEDLDSVSDLAWSIISSSRGPGTPVTDQETWILLSDDS